METRAVAICFMKCRPTRSELFANPLGCLSLADRNSKTAELMAPQATTTISLVNQCRSPAISVSTLVTSRPDSLVCNCKTLALVISVKLEYDSRVGRMALWSESALAPTKQGYPSNVSQRMQGLFVRSALTLEDSL